jgi:hypothetical protein
MKKKTIIDGATEVAQDAFNNLSMFICWCMHELRHSVNSK